ncbi:hypothetical protein JM79_1319 [Gramella sp. Hel_I_59]|uniref:Gfo/Idh/MocA family oxidoreductase n=1 Tax=Gramella sp. Hel_I_59 TaxID=1249978 RepID=UPI001154CCAF|nr:Gfo/Idh/MocA family oxidoreductase [Gramella sp. Hel_I_59]TQI70409.1 hypothetical protein JM79_1319 [Gramella sp. Hel_I_59]
MASKIRLGIIGMSKGNGHPYSWSAIFNGYNREIMEECPFPAIPAYLKNQQFPEDGLGELGQVTHIWTQDRKLSEHIAKASNIDWVVDRADEMIGKVDAILLARDDAEHHVEMAIPFLDAGIPIFIDKPFALSISDAEKMLSCRVSKNQIFTCSSIRYAEELKLTTSDRETLGEILYVEAGISKEWDTYAIHVIEPIIAQFPDRGNLLELKAVKNNAIHQALIKWEHLNAYIKVTGSLPTLPFLTFYGLNGTITKRFKDSFACFRSSLFSFIKQIEKDELLIPEEETLELVKIIEWGRK